MHIAPLKNSFMVISIIGMIISYNVWAAYPSWAFSFMLIFVLMFVASLISMTYAPLGSYELKKK